MTNLHDPAADVTPVKPAHTPQQLRQWRDDRIREIREEGAIRRQPCPRCGALPGEPCHSEPSWWPTDAHAGRRRAAGVA